MKALLDRLETLSHNRRIQEMLAIGRAAADHRALLDELSKGDAYQRSMALYSCCTSGDAERVASFLKDPSSRLRGLARILAVRFCSDATILALLEDLPVRNMRTVLLGLIKNRRQALIDRWYQENSRGSGFLPFCSEAVVELHFERFVEYSCRDDSSRMARFHPRLIERHLENWVSKTEKMDYVLIGYCHQVLPVLADVHPQFVVRLARQLAIHHPLNRFNLYHTALRVPVPMAELVLERNERTNLHFDTRVAQIPLSLLQRLIDKSVLTSPSHWFQRLPRDARRKLFEAYGIGWRAADGSLPEALVQRLPQDLRVPEARRHLSLSELATRPSRLFAYVSFLPFQEAQEWLKPWLGDPDPDLRKDAVKSLIAAARYDSASYDGALEAVRRRKNEQDPIRLAMFQALGNLPPGRWRESQLESIAGALQEGLNAADLSYATGAAMAHLVGRLLPHFPRWAADWMARIVQERGHLQLGHLRGRLSDSQVDYLAPYLTPVLHTWEQRQRERCVIDAAQAFDGRLWAELLDILERLIRVSVDNYVSTSALALLRENAAARYHKIIPELLLKDETWGLVAPVYMFLHRHRQDLLTPYLSLRTMKGRFSTGMGPVLLPLSSGFERWTTLQQKLFHESVAAVASDPKRDVPAMYNIVSQLAALPPGIGTLRDLAAVDDSRPAVRDLAVRALARRDESDGIPTLLDALGDERARIAIYALRRALRETPSAETAQILGAAPTKKVTVAKEVLRLLGELPSRHSYDRLLEWSARELHRDVRVALLRAFWDHLERAETWAILFAAAQSEDRAVASGVLRIPADGLGHAERERLVQLMAMLLGHADTKVRLDTQTRLANMPVNDVNGALAEGLAKGLESESSDERRAAGSAWLRLSRRTSSLVELARNRKALLTLTELVLGEVARDGDRVRPLVDELLEGWSGDPVALGSRSRLAVASFAPEELAKWLSGREWDFTSLGVAVEAVTRRYEDLDGVDAALQGSANPALRRLGLAALITSAGAPRGWSDARRERLELYRADPDTGVRAAAEFVFPV